MQISRLLSQKGFTDELPSYDGVCDDITASLDYSGNISILIETNNASAVFNKYCSNLEKAEFVYDTTALVCTYKSPNNQYAVAVSTNRFGVDLTLTKIETQQQQGESEFPMDKIIEDFPSAKDVLPGIEKEGALFVYDDTYSGEATLTITFATSEDATSTYETYIAALETAGFTSETVWGMNVYVSPDRLFMLELNNSKINNGSFEICFMDTYGSI